jgi:DNA-binding NtrC family response regulator
MAIVLLVDDDAGGLEIRKMLLERHGHRVSTASDAATARDKFREATPEQQLVDEVLAKPVRSERLSNAVKKRA